MLEPGFVNRHDSLEEPGNLVLINVDAGDIDTKLCKACSGNESYITGTYHCDMHLATTSLTRRKLACEAGVSIKPGARAQDQITMIGSRAREMGDSAQITDF